MNKQDFLSINSVTYTKIAQKLKDKHVIKCCTAKTKKNGI